MEKAEQIIKIAKKGRAFNEYINIGSIQYDKGNLRVYDLSLQKYNIYNLDSTILNGDESLMTHQYQFKQTPLGYIEKPFKIYHNYDKYIAVLNKKTLYTYNSSGQNVAENDINISSPIFANKNKFLAIAENNGSKLYLMSGTNIVWQNTLEGKISKISINKNGYVSVIVSGTSYKSVIILMDPKGKELFKTYLSSNIAILRAGSAQDRTYEIQVCVSQLRLRDKRPFTYPFPPCSPEGAQEEAQQEADASFLPDTPQPHIPPGCPERPALGNQGRLPCH